MRPWGVWGCSLVIAITVAACNTTPKRDTAERVNLAPITPFVPAAPAVLIRADESRYPNLFTPDSFAVWITPEVAAVKRQEDIEEGLNIPPVLDSTASLVGDNFYVFECHIASAFPDASIAYDSVGLRHIDAYLVSPDGHRISPIQRILGSHADEEPVDALRRFRRTNVLVFPKRDIILNQPTINPHSPGVRLVLEGFHSTFYFEWTPAGGTPPPDDPTLRDHAAAAYASAKMGFTEIFSKLRAAAHVFD